LRDLIVIGGGEHGRVVIDAALSRPDLWRVIGFLDRQPCEETVSRFGVRRLGTGDDADSIVAQHRQGLFALGIGAIGNAELREAIVSRFSDAGAQWATVVHRQAAVSPTATVGNGTVVFAQAVINTGARIGSHCVINTGAVVEHDVVIDDFSQIAPGGTLGGGARVGRRTYVGLGSRIRDHVQVGNRAFVGMGSVVTSNVDDGREVIGVPARDREKADSPHSGIAVLFAVFATLGLCAYAYTVHNYGSSDWARVARIIRTLRGGREEQESNVGRWVTPPFKASDFSAREPTRWIVEPSGVQTYASTVIGKTKTVNFFLSATSIQGMPSDELRIAVPGKSRIARRAFAVCFVKDGLSGWAPGTIDARDQGNVLYVSRGFLGTAGKFSLSDHGTWVAGSITFEIE